MKNFNLILLIMFLGCAQVWAQDYVLISDKPVKAVYVRNEEIMTAKAVYTINNDKKSVILSPKKDGKTVILVNRFDEEILLNVKIKEGEIKIKTENGFEYFPLDNPPKALDILPPPLIPEK